MWDILASAALGVTYWVLRPARGHRAWRAIAGGGSTREVLTSGGGMTKVA